MNTMINHHPDARILNEFCAGALPLAPSVCVSVHLHFCARCKRQCDQLQQIGAEMFDRLSPRDVDEQALERLLQRLDEAPPLSYESTGAGRGGPALVQRLMHGDYEDLEWKRINASLQIAHLHTGDTQHEFALYHIKAGGSIPRHTHRCTELIQILEGGFSDEQGIYHRGDFIESDASDEHTPTAFQSEDCICIGVLDAPIRFKPWRYRLLNPFLRLRV